MGKKGDPVNISVDTVHTIIDELKKIDFAKADYDDVKSKVDLLLQCGCMALEFPEDKVIYRGRIWDPARENVFTKKSHISYPPTKSGGLLAFNRASSNRFQIFYGATGTPDMEAAEIIAMTEICNVIDDDFPPEEYEYAMIGQWIVKIPFMAASLGLHSDIAKSNQQAQDMLEFHNEACNDLDDRGRAIDEVGKFISQEFSKKVNKGSEHEYMISAAVGDILFQGNVGAILFPSVKADGRSFNVALRNDVVDSCLELRLAGITRSRKIEKRIVTEWYLQSPEIIGDKFDWKEPDQSISAYEWRIIENRIKAGLSL